MSTIRRRADPPLPAAARVHRFPHAPAAILALRTDHRGFPVPWFVGDVDGKPDFRVIGARKMHLAVTRRLCWVCGRKLGRMLSFPIGPMCAVNRVSAEPPSHPECARFSAEACPFLTNPRMRRNGKDLPEHEEPPGLMIDRNPGVVLLWWTLRYSTFDDGAGGTLYKLGAPERTHWLAEGREATREEVLKSIITGLPILVDAARRQGPDAIAALDAACVAALELVPV